MKQVSITLPAGSIVLIYHNLKKELKEASDALANAEAEEVARVVQLSPELALKKDKAHEVLTLGKFYIERAIEIIEPEYKKLTPNDL